MGASESFKRFLVLDSPECASRMLGTVFVSPISSTATPVGFMWARGKGQVDIVEYKAEKMTRIAGINLWLVTEAGTWVGNTERREFRSRWVQLLDPLEEW